MKSHRDGNADWPGLAINYTNKTQFLFRINNTCRATKPGYRRTPRYW